MKAGPLIGVGNLLFVVAIPALGFAKSRFGCGVGLHVEASALDGRMTGFLADNTDVCKSAF